MKIFYNNRSAWSIETVETESFYQKDSRDTDPLTDIKTNLMRSLFSQRSSTSEAVTAELSHGSSEGRQPSQVGERTFGNFWRLEV